MSIRPNVSEAVNIIHKLKWNATDPRMDGFNTWGYKQDLYRLLWEVQDALNACSTYVDEDKFVAQRTFELLKRKQKS